MTYLLIVLAIIAVVFVVYYNRLVKLRQTVRNAWADIDVQLKRRWDLIPNLVDAVKGYMSFEESVLREMLTLMEGLQPVEVSDGRAMLLVPRESRGVAPALESLYAAGLQLDDVLIKEPNLEDLFLKLTGRELRN